MSGFIQRIRKKKFTINFEAWVSVAGLAYDVEEVLDTILSDKRMLQISKSPVEPITFQHQLLSAKLRVSNPPSLLTSVESCEISKTTSDVIIHYTDSLNSLKAIIFIVKFMAVKGYR